MDARQATPGIGARKQAHSMTSRANGASDRAAMTRTEFLFALGAGAVAAIAGYTVAPPSAAAATPRTPRATARPRLRDDVTRGRENGMLTLRRPGSAAAHGAVNETGERVARLLDGEHTVEMIAGDVAREVGVTCTSETVGAVAGFIAQLAVLAFLDEPFYAVIATQVEA